MSRKNPVSLIRPHFMYQLSLAGDQRAGCTEMQQPDEAAG
jgi:hypothetical protein